MSEDFLGGDRWPGAAGSSITPSELAAFLNQLAALYSSEIYGNQALGHALRDLAKAVKRGEFDSAPPVKKRVEKAPQLSEPQLEQLRRLSSESVQEMLTDETRTKADLLALASVRFSMPTSQLKRLRTEELRAAISSALNHENSIKILSTEADKDGAQRTG